LVELATVNQAEAGRHDLNALRKCEGRFELNLVSRTRTGEGAVAKSLPACGRRMIWPIPLAFRRAARMKMVASIALGLKRKMVGRDKFSSFCTDPYCLEHRLWISVASVLSIRACASRSIMIALENGRRWASLA
jgi:hypothetical protein